MENKYINYSLSIGIIVLTMLYIKNRYEEQEDSEVEERVEYNNFCMSLYTGNNKKYAVIKKAMSSVFCKELIKSAEDYATKFMWTKKRHANYPTVDNEITPKWNEYEQIEALVKRIISHKLAELYNIDPSLIGINELFIVKYDMGGQTHLEYHHDMSEFSFVLQLNDDFGGGGTKFEYDNQLIRLDVGDCLIFSGQNRHRGEEITSGTRYILAGFLKYGDTCMNSTKNEF